MPVTDYEPVIGLEVHVQLSTRTKLFCACPSKSFGLPPNSHICPVCAGHPGVLPVTNRKAVELGLRAALAVGCKIRERSIFARKNYFYPDLPKAYQISQYEEPFSYSGKLEIGGGKSVGIHRIHLEEDAGKLLHAIGSEELPYSLVDLNRAGVPLCEIVSEPEIFSADEAYAYLTELKQVLQYMEVSTCDMEKGEMRCDANVSLKKKGATKLGTRAEIKNLNSFKAVKEAILHEMVRQADILDAGGTIVQETRLWDDTTLSTAPMRSKEEAHDYRYFPEPDLVPLVISREWQERTLKSLPETPQRRQKRFQESLHLGEYDAAVLVATREKADFYEETLKLVSSGKGDAETAKLVANWVSNQHEFALKESGSEGLTGKAPALAEVIALVKTGAISNASAKEVLLAAYKTGKAPKTLVEETGAAQVSDEGALKGWAQEAIAENAAAVADFKSGKEAALGRIVGAVMKKSKGKANPQKVNSLLKDLLKP